MEIKIQRTALLGGIQIVQNAVSQKSSLPILNNVLIEADNNELKLTATDLDIGISAVTQAEVAIGGAITIPARKFFDIVKELPDGSEIFLSMKKNNFVNIKGGKSNFKIIGLPKEEFPQLPIFKDEDAVEIKESVLKEMFNLTDFAVSRDDTRYVLNGVFLTIKGDNISMVATDGRRLAAINKKIPEKTLIDRRIIIPTKTVQEVKRLLTSDEAMVTIKFGENQVMFMLAGCIILSRLIEGEYPNYKNVIPEKAGEGIKINRDEFLSAAKRASIFTDQDSMAIKLSIKPKKMIISKNTPYLGETKEEIDIDYANEKEIDIGFNPRYLIDVLKNLTDPEILFEITDANKPGVVRWGEEYTYVLLPMQLNAG